MKKITLSFKGFSGNIFRSEPHTVGEKANHDWKIVLVTSIFLFAGILGVSWYMFFSTSEYEVLITGTPRDVTQVSVDEKNLNRALLIMEERQQRGLVVDEVPQVEDPSL